MASNYYASHADLTNYEFCKGISGKCCFVTEYLSGRNYGTISQVRNSANFFAHDIFSFNQLDMTNKIFFFVFLQSIYFADVYFVSMIPYLIQLQLP
jgi:hypothetical protein